MQHVSSTYVLVQYIPVSLKCYRHPVIGSDQPLMGNFSPLELSPNTAE